MKNQEQFMNLILDHYENPRNYGSIESADVIHEGGNPGCGDVIKIYLSVDSEGKVQDIKFSGEGCMISQAGTSLMLEEIKGRPIEEIENISPDLVKEILGKKIVSTRPKCAMLGFNGVKNTIREFKKKEILSTLKD